jgi:hypothetical protein
VPPGDYLLGNFALAGFRPVMQRCAPNRYLSTQVIDFIDFLSVLYISQQAECDTIQSLDCGLARQIILQNTTLPDRDRSFPPLGQTTF